LKVRYPDGTSGEVELWLEGGAPCEVEFDEAGNRRFRRATLRRLDRRKDVGAFRLYGEYELADGGNVSLPLYVTAEDQQLKFNRTEHCRPFPSGSEQYEMQPRPNSRRAPPAWPHRAKSRCRRLGKWGAVASNPLQG
jgi:hypothetical protein